MVRTRWQSPASVMLLASILAACNIPFLADSGEQPAPTEPAPAPTETEIPASPVALSTEAPLPTHPPLGPPIAHLEPEQLVLITFIQMVSPTAGWGVGGLEGAQDHVLRTLDGGTTWQDVTPPEPAPEVGAPAKRAVAVFLDAQVGHVLYYPASLIPEPADVIPWATQDGGATWTAGRSMALEFLGSTDFPPVLRFVDSDNGWLLAQAGPAGMHRYPVYLLRTGDAGATWEMLLDPFQGADLQSCNKTGLSFLDRSLGWATVADCPVDAPELWVTADGGRTWQSRQLPAPASRPTLFEDALCEAHSPQLLTASIGAVGLTCRLGLNISYIYLTQDGGATWEPHLYPGGTLDMLTPRVGFALSRRIYQTLDGGVNWTATKVVDWDGQFSWVDERTGWAVARSGQALALVKTENAGQIWDLLKPRIGP